MKLFEIFKTSSKDTPKDSTDGQEVAVAQKGKTPDAVAPQTKAPIAAEEPEPKVQAENESKPAELITIAYGTGMPIDVIYAYIGKDYEPEGYQDALVNSSVEYCKAKENIILNKLQQLFRQVSLAYNGEIRKLNVQIENSKSLFNITSASMLEARRDTCEEHIKEINEMREKLKVNAPEMMTMIDSYRRGFSKGVSAQTASFLGGIQNYR